MGGAPTLVYLQPQLEWPRFHHGMPANLLPGLLALQSYFESKQHFC